MLRIGNEGNGISRGAQSYRRWYDQKPRAENQRGVGGAGGIGREIKIPKRNISTWDLLPFFQIPNGGEIRKMGKV